MISVVIPTYNRRELLVRAVQSVLEQSRRDLEVIVVDDGSTDGTEQWLKEKIDDPRIRYVRQENSGECAARNRGVSLARGEWIAFHDSDDTWRPEKLRTQMEQLKASGADIVFCAFERHWLGREETQVFPHAHIPAGWVSYEQLLFENLISTQTMIGRRACFTDTPFDEGFPRMQDWELALRLTQKYDVRYFSDVLVDMYEQADSISRKPERAVRALRMLWEKHRSAINASRTLTDQMLRSIYTACAACGRPRDTWRDCFQAAALRPARERLLYRARGVMELLGLWELMRRVRRRLRGGNP